MATGLRKVMYQCNYCKKSRILYLPHALNIFKENQTGLVQLTDIHLCTNNILSAILCYVDSSYNVRSQVKITATQEGYEIERDLDKKDSESKEPTLPFAIPLPSKTSEVKIKIDLPDNDFNFSNIIGINIKDKIRKREYYFGDIDKGKSFIGTSQLDFIKVVCSIKERTAKKVYKNWTDAKKKGSVRAAPYSVITTWLKTLANSIESLVYLKDDLLGYLLEFLDGIIATSYSDQIKNVLELLLRSDSTFPIARKEKISEFDEKAWNKEFKDLTLPELINYKHILLLCKENSSKNVTELYEEVKKKFTYSTFLLALSLLLEKGYITFNKLEFM